MTNIYAHLDPLCAAPQREGHGRSVDPAVEFDLEGRPPDLLVDPDFESLNGFVNGVATLCPAVCKSNTLFTPVVAVLYQELSFSTVALINKIKLKTSES